MSWIQEAEVRKNERLEQERLASELRLSDENHFNSENPVTQEQVTEFMSRFTPVIAPVIEELREKGYDVNEKSPELIAQSSKPGLHDYLKNYSLTGVTNSVGGSGYYDSHEYWAIFGTPWEIDGLGVVSMLPRVDKRTHFASVDFVSGSYKELLASVNVEDLERPEKIQTVQELLRNGVAGMIELGSSQFQLISNPNYQDFK